MTQGEIPRDADGRRLCEHCLVKPVPESLGTKPRSYCSRNCRQRAYEARRQGRFVKQTVNMALLRERMMRANATQATSRDNPEAKSRDDAGDQATSRDVASAPAATRPTPAPAEPRPPVQPPTQAALFEEEDQADEEEAPRPPARRMTDLLKQMPKLPGGFG
nr:hypothetical protein [Streptomyces natalensis]